MMEVDKIYLGDCLEGLRSLPDKCIDLIVTDPPYKIEGDGGGGCFGSKKRKYHNTLSELKAGITNEVIDEMVRVCKLPNMYIFCSKEQLPQYLNYAVEHNFRFDLLTWHKTNPTPMCNNKYLSDTEYIVFLRKGARIYGTYDTKRKYFISKCNAEDKKMWLHPTIKPVEILKTLITNALPPPEYRLCCIRSIYGLRFDSYSSYPFRSSFFRMGDKSRISQNCA